MPKEKASHLPLANFSDIKIKEQFVVKDSKRGISTTNKPNAIIKENKDNRSTSSTIAVEPSETVLSPKKQPNNYQKYIDDCEPAPSLNSSLSQQNTTENNNTTTKPVQSSMTAVQSSGPTVNNRTPSKRSANDFIFGKYIGEGSFSTVYLAREINTRREYASKLAINTFYNFNNTHNRKVN